MSCFCARCGEELQAPKFHNGLPYGYSCYEIVAGVKSTDKRKWVKTDSLVADIPAGARITLKVKYNNQTFNVGICYRDINGNIVNKYIQTGADGFIYMVTHDKNGKSVWKSI